MTTVCLTMIVKNEAHCIARGLASIKPHIDAFAIVDTGSTDNTKGEILGALEGLPGQLVSRDWNGFGDARSASLRLAQDSGCDYAFVLDADEIFTPRDGFAWPTDGKDFYAIEYAMNGVVWPQGRLFRLACGWRYEGVIHEYPFCEGARTRGLIENMTLTSPRDGARSKNPNKYRDDAHALEALVEKEPHSARYVFYCAQSWRDAKEWEKAIVWYERRVTMGEGLNGAEITISLLEIAKAMHRSRSEDASRHTVEQVRAAYLRAYALDPSRAEPLCHLAMFCREVKDYALAWHFASLATTKEEPKGLFVDTKIYQYLAKDELAIALAHLGRVDASIGIIDNILETVPLPDRERARIEKNRVAFVDALTKKTAKKAA